MKNLNMNSKFTRRNILAAGAALFTTSAFGTKETESEEVQANKNAIKTRTASCNCGQLSVTCIGPDPERISLCHCNLCQKQSGSAFAIQARFPREQVTIKGKATEWKFPIAGEEPVKYRTCADTGATFYFCPECASTVYYTSDLDSKRIGVKIGAFADPTFPPPKITGFEEYRHPWVMNIKKLAMKVVA